MAEKIFPTTHAGSLPRPLDLVRMMFAKEEGVPVQADALRMRIHEAVDEVLGRQVACGVDVVNDGEMSKPSYATYIKDRLDGFGGESQPPPYPDLVPFPGLQQKVYGDRGRSRRKMPGCRRRSSSRSRCSGIPWRSLWRLRFYSRWRRWFGPLAAVPGIGPLARVMMENMAPGLTRALPKSSAMHSFMDIPTESAWP